VTIATQWLHVVCPALVVLDLLLRSQRVRLLMWGAGTEIAYRDALALTAFGDAAALLTPWRAGGEVGRVIGARAAGAPLPVVAAVLSLELLLAYAVAAVAGVWLVAEFGGAWWAAVGPAAGASSTLRTIAIVVVAGAAGLTIVAGSVPAINRRIAAALAGARAAVAAAFRIPLRTLATGLALSVLSLASRVAILPLLASLLPESPPMGVLALASFTLHYAQVALPTPAGAGPIELAVLQGGLGTTEAGALLGWWRLYMTILPAAGGLVLGAIVYGPRAMRLPFFGKGPAIEPDVA
jgi:hypothetical protein